MNLVELTEEYNRTTNGMRFKHFQSLDKPVTFHLRLYAVHTKVEARPTSSVTPRARPSKRDAQTTSKNNHPKSQPSHSSSSTPRSKNRNQSSHTEGLTSFTIYLQLWEKVPGRLCLVAEKAETRRHRSNTAADCLPTSIPLPPPSAACTLHNGSQDSGDGPCRKGMRTRVRRFTSLSCLSAWRGGVLWSTWWGASWVKVCW